MNIFLPTIYGFNKASEISDNTFAPSIFLKGCNFRCPYCMNAPLANGTITKEVDLEDVKKFVKEEKCEWIMISGGEPTRTTQFKLMVLLGEILSWGCKIGMSTNGSNPTVLSDIIKHLNYVALDIKASNKKDYETLVGSQYMYPYENMRSSRYLLMVSKQYRTDFNYELRTTLYPPLINEKTLAEIGSNFIKKEDKWVLQQFRHSKYMIDPSCKDITPYSDDALKSLIEIAKQFCDNVSLRYV